MKIFVTSRDDGNVLALFPDAKSLRIQKEHTCKDLEAFVRQGVSHTISIRVMLHGSVTPELERDLVAALLDGAEDI